MTRSMKSMLDIKTGLPRPPFWFLFTTAERVLLGLLFQAQRENLYLHLPVHLATAVGPSGLPGPYQPYTIVRWATYFPSEILDLDATKSILKGLLGGILCTQDLRRLLGLKTMLDYATTGRAFRSDSESYTTEESDISSAEIERL